MQIFNFDIQSIYIVSAVKIDDMVVNKMEYDL
jgi:hypothetical protein